MKAIRPKNLEAFFLRKRDDFPILSQEINGKNLIYFDNGATTQKPIQVIEKISEVYKNFYANIHRGVHLLSVKSSEEFEKVREKCAKFINAKKNEIVFTKGTTDGLNLLAFGLKHILKSGDEILISQMEHHGNLVPWQEVCKKTGAILKFIPITENFELDLSLIEKLISEKTKIVSVTHISNVLGTVNPVQKISKLAKKVGAIFIVDSAQSAGHKKIDVKKLGCDAFVFSSHKTYGPTGVGILYTTESLMEKLEPQEFGGDMIDEVYFTHSTYKKGFGRYEAGTPNIADVIAFGSAIDYLEEIGMENIETYESFLTEYFLEKSKEVPEMKIFGPKLQNIISAELNKSIQTERRRALDSSASFGMTEKTLGDYRAPIFSFWFDGIHPHDLGTILDNHGIAVRTGHHCAMPLHEEILKVPATTRVSLSFYNTKGEIDKFFEIVGSKKNSFGKILH